mgnify:CR=1 FL=1
MKINVDFSLPGEKDRRAGGEAEPEARLGRRDTERMRSRCRPAAAGSPMTHPGPTGQTACRSAGAVVAGMETA